MPKAEATPVIFYGGRARRNTFEAGSTDKAGTTDG